MTIFISLKAHGNKTIAEGAGLSATGRSGALALDLLLSKIAKEDPELVGSQWRVRGEGLSGTVGAKSPERRRRSNPDKGAVFDLLGGKMNGTARFKL